MPRMERRITLHPMYFMSWVQKLFLLAFRLMDVISMMDVVLPLQKR